jgi:hypothetical protein
MYLQVICVCNNNNKKINKLLVLLHLKTILRSTHRFPVDIFNLKIEYKTHGI